MKRFHLFVAVTGLLFLADWAVAQSSSYTELNNLVVVYRHSNKGDLPSTILNDLQVSLDRASEFYWRNSHMSVMPRWELYDVTDPIDFVRDNGYIYPFDVNSDLHDRGFTDNTYDAVYVVAAGSGNFAWGVNRVLGRGGYCQTGWWGSDYGAWPSPTSTTTSWMRCTRPRAIRSIRTAIPAWRGSRASTSRTAAATGT